MTSRKIKLQSSINSINAKTAPNRKPKPAAKLKTVLSNPIKPKNETLSIIESLELDELIQVDIKNSHLSGRKFARKSKFYLGLGSSLRAIKYNKMSCVLISDTIKPNFIVNQIASFVRQKNKTVPVYIVANLETMVEKLFTVKSYVVAFPHNLTGALGEWVSSRTIPWKEGNKTTGGNKLFQSKDKSAEICDLNLIFLPKESRSSRSFIPETVVKPQKPTRSETNGLDWTGDYISFSDSNNQKKKDDSTFEKEKYKVLTALKKMSSNIQEGSNQDVSRKSSKYLHLKAHKIQPNPQRVIKQNTREVKSLEVLK